MDAITLGIALASFGTGLATNLFIFGWKAKSVEANLRQDMTAAVSKLTESIREEHDEAMERIGKAVADLQTKVFEVEIWGRDNYVRRTDFLTVIDGVQRSVEGMGVKIDAAVLRIENKIEKLRDREHE